MTTAIYPGSFDPPTLGHFDIAKRGAKLFEKLYVAVGINSQKKHTLFSIEERIRLLERLFADFPDIHVVHYEGLLVDYVVENSIDVILRSVRNGSDLDFETSFTLLNRDMAENIETLLMVPSSQHIHISSSLVREILISGRKIEEWIPEEISEFVNEKINQL